MSTRINLYQPVYPCINPYHLESPRFNLYQLCSLCRFLLVFVVNSLSNCKGVQVGKKSFLKLFMDPKSVGKPQDKINWVKLSLQAQKLWSTCNGPQIFGSQILNVCQPVKVYRLREKPKKNVWSEKCPSTLHIMEGWGLDRQPIDVWHVEPQKYLGLNLTNI